MARLYYRVGSAVHAVEVQGASSAFRIGEHQRLFDGPYASSHLSADYDVDPTGRRLAVTRVGVWEGRLVMVQNFFTELQRLVPN